MLYYYNTSGVLGLLLTIAHNGCGHTKSFLKGTIWAEQSVAVCPLLYAPGVSGDEGATATEVS